MKGKVRKSLRGLLAILLCVAQLLEGSTISAIASTTSTGNAESTIESDHGTEDGRDQEKKKYTIKYFGNAEGAANVPEDSRSYPYADPVVISTQTPTLENGVFLSWNTDADGYGVDYFPGESLQLCEDLCLYAQWNIRKTLDETSIGYEEAEPVRYYAAAANSGVVGLTAKEEEAYFGGLTKFYQKQTYNKKGEGQCVRNSLTSLLRRRCILDKAIPNLTWDEIKNEGVHAQDDYYHNLSDGRRIQFKLYFCECDDHRSKSKNIPPKTEYEFIESDKNALKLKLKVIELLRDHQDGIVYYLSNANGGSPMHAVVITSYRYGIFYCVDPVMVEKGKGEIPIEESTFKTGGKYVKDKKDIFSAVSDGDMKVKIFCINTDCVVCKHEYKNDGYCKNCKRMAPHNNSNVTYKEGLYKIKGGSTYVITTVVKKEPFSGSKDVILYNSGTDGIEVIGAVENYFGKKWYEIKKGQIKGYLPESDLEWYKSLPSNASLSFSGIKIKKTIPQGESYRIEGNITVNHCKMTKIKGYFLDANNKKYQETSSKLSGKDTTKLLLQGSIINKRLIFGDLEPGKYKCVVEVTTDKEVNGKKVTKYTSNEFTVKAQSIKKPTLDLGETFYGGATYIIKNSNKNEKLYYSVDDEKPFKSTDKSSFPIRITGSTVIKAYVKDERYMEKWEVTIPKLESPDIVQSQNGNGTTVRITTENTGAAIYYKIDNGSEKQYNKAFLVTEKCTVSAYAKKAGAINSGTTSVTIEVGAPDIPVISLDTSKNIGEGDAVSVHWATDKKANKYEVTVTKDNVEQKKETVSRTQYTFNAETVGTYKVSVVAVNAVGKSKSSNAVSATVHAPVTVRFVQDSEDENNKEVVIDTREVRYGGSVETPAAPSRRGYTFDGWKGNRNNITSDTTIVATYTKNIYTVKFYEGDEFIGSQEIKYNQDITMSEMATNIEDNLAPGTTITGWHIFDVKDEKSLLDLKHIDSDMSIRVAISRENENLPVKISDVGVTVNTVEDALSGYHVTCKISNTETKNLKVKLLITLLAKSTADSNMYRMVNTKVVTMDLFAGTKNKSWNGDVVCEEKADRVEISVVSIEGTDRTGTVLAEASACEITEEAAMVWSDWVTKDKLIAAGHNTTDADVKSKTQYRKRDNYKSTVTNNSAQTPAGYDGLLSKTSKDGTWSGWSDTPVKATSTRKVETKQVTVKSGYTQYRYGAWTNNSTRHFCGALGKSLYGGTWKKVYTDWSKTRYTPIESSTWGKCSYSTHGDNHVGYTKSGSTYYWTKYKINSKVFYWEERKYVDTSTTKTQYRYCDVITSYTYYKWNYGTWSEWSDEVIVDKDTSDDSFQVETRELYQYKTAEAVGTKTESTGIDHTTKVSMGEELGNRKATILVYKSQNTDPTESQLEYVRQATLDKDGACEFKFITREKPTKDTNDFIVTLAVEGVDDLVDIDVIRYERPEYKVVFKTEEGVIIGEEQWVQEGEDAQVPEAPAKQGYIFARYDRNTTNVQKDITATARYIPQTYCVAYVDYLNHNCTLSRQSGDGDLIIPEETLSHDGYDFLGWDDGGDSSKVTDDRVVTAMWKAKEYVVSFYDYDGNVVESQTVPYGQSANPPAALEVPEGYCFLGWSEENEWWDVCESVGVNPIVVMEDTAVAPLFNVEPYTEGIQEEVEISAAEGATIYYTLDGSTPKPENVIESEESVVMISEVADNMAGISEAGGSDDGDDRDGDIGDEDIEDEDLEEGVTYLYQGPITLTEDAYITAIAVEKDKNISECVTHAFSYEEEVENVEDCGEMVELFADEVDVDKGDTVSIEVSVNGVNSLKGYMLAIDADPSVFSLIGADNEYGCELSAGDLCKDNGTLFANVYEDGYGWKIYWNGERELSGSGSLFTLKFMVSDNAVYRKYPIKASYSTVYTYDANILKVSLDNIMSVSLSKNGTSIGNNASLKVLEIPDQIYTGKAIKPSVVLYDNGVLLEQNKDYTLSYKNNIKVNDIADTDTSPKVIIKGKGNYSDSMTVQFNILPADICDDEFTCDDVVVKANGRVQKPVPVVYGNGKKLKVKKDFTVTYYDEDGARIVQPSAIGTYTIRVTGKDNYTNSRDIKLILSENEPVSKATVAPISTYEYSGSPIEPKPVVTMGSIVLTEEDYSLAYENNVNAGTATIIITGKNKYRGTKRVPFKINGISISRAKISNLGQYTYSGDDIEPEITVAIDGMVLTPEKDYTFSFKNNKNVGTANVIVTGNGRYSGTLKKSFKIAAIDIAQNKSDYQLNILDENGEVIKGNRVDVFYQKGGATPRVEVVCLSTGKVLKEGTDYTVSYKRNKKLSMNQSAQPEVIVKGRKNYKGSLAMNFDVIAQDINKLDVLVSDKAFSKKAKGFMVAPIIRDTNGKRLEAGKDYEKSCVYVYENDATINDNIIRKAGENVGDTDIVPIGTKLKVTIQGKDCYAGSKVEAVYEIVANDISKAQVVLKDKVYNGKNITLNADNDEIRVVYNHQKLKEGVDYQIVGYEHNRDKGKATVIIEGIGNYGGNKSANFKIRARNFLWWVM